MDGVRLATLLLGVALVQGCGMRNSGGDLAPPPPSAAGLLSTHDRARLEALASARAANPTNEGYRIGPDDLLDIRVPDLLEAQTSGSAHTGQGSNDTPTVAGAPVYQQGFRVNAAGDVNLPALGVVHAADLSPGELEDAIAHRLVDAGILRAPHVTVLVSEYRSHVVAVVGSVEHPGLYPVTRPGSTLADMIWAAGGPSHEAGRVIEFTPAPEADRADPSPIHLDLEMLLHPAGKDTVASLPARPGDVLNVAPAGSVLVDGWVDKPGSYQVTRGLTVSGAVAAAGGAVFAADKHRVVVKRVLWSGDDGLFTVDLDAVAHGLAPDVPVADGDIVRLPASRLRVIPWGVWTIAREMVHIGGNVLLF